MSNTKTIQFGALALSSFLLFLLAACSETEFSAAPGSVFQQCVSSRPEVKCLPCVNTTDGATCIDQYDYTIQADAQIKDILFVVDNSGSMYSEQRRMGSMFPDFISMLQNVNYRIAITTTDVESDINPADDVNKMGALQNGNLIPFENSASFLDGSLSTEIEQDYFEKAITRQETLTCEDNDYEELFCPSGIERGIYAAALTMNNNPDGFIRDTGHMAMVILSDEDEGSQGDLVDPSIEEPNNFIANFKTMYPNKSLSVHSIIIQPGDDECLDSQRVSGHPPGYFGDVYSELTGLTTGGIQGDICASDSNYSAQLAEMGRSISQVREALPCAPVNGEIEVEFSPEPGFDVDFVFNASQNEVTFSQGLPATTEIRFQFECERGNEE